MVVIASPGYHGTVSGLVKNSLDYLEVLREDDRPYLDGRAVGVIAVASSGGRGVHQTALYLWGSCTRCAAGRPRSASRPTA